MLEFNPNPHVTAKLVAGTRQVKIAVCPFCKKTHLHGAGPGPGVSGVLGHRVAHCRPEDLPASLQGLSLGYFVHIDFRTDEERREQRLKAELLF